MKKIKYIILIGILFVQTGCMKAKVDMTINKDKSVNFSYEAGISKSFLNSSTSDDYGIDSEEFTVSDEEIAEAKEQGYEVSNYDDGTYVGSKMTKTFKNIDSISTTEDITGSLSDLTNTEEENIKFFTVKKGFFKNTYSAKIDTSETNNMKDLIESNYEDEDNASDSSTTNSSLTTNSSTTNSSSSNNLNTTTTTDTVDYEAMMSAMGMDLSFNINLPYKVLSSNATTVSDDGKTLSWNLLNFSDDIEFTFELYNMSNIYIALGVGILLMIIIIILIIVLLRKKKNKKLSDDSMSLNRGLKEEYPSVTNMTNQVPTEPIIQNQAQVQHTIPVTAKPVLQPNPIEPSPQPINMNNLNSNNLNSNIDGNINNLNSNVNNNINNQNQSVNINQNQQPIINNSIPNQIPTASSQEIVFTSPTPVQNINRPVNQNVMGNQEEQANISSPISNVGINQGQVSNMNNNLTNLNNGTINQAQNNNQENPVDIFGANNF